MIWDSGLQQDVQHIDEVEKSPAGKPLQFSIGWVDYRQGVRSGVAQPRYIIPIGYDFKLAVHTADRKLGTRTEHHYTLEGLGSEACMSWAEGTDLHFGGVDV
jgi:hypothetical protein